MYRKLLLPVGAGVAAASLYHKRNFIESAWVSGQLRRSKVYIDQDAHAWHFTLPYGLIGKSGEVVGKCDTIASYQMKPERKRIDPPEDSDPKIQALANRILNYMDHCDKPKECIARLRKSAVSRWEENEWRKGSLGLGLDPEMPSSEDDMALVEDIAVAVFAASTILNTSIPVMYQDGPDGCGLATHKGSVAITSMPQFGMLTPIGQFTSGLRVALGDSDTRFPDLKIKWMRYADHKAFGLPDGSLMASVVGFEGKERPLVTPSEDPLPPESERQANWDRLRDPVLARVNEMIRDHRQFSILDDVHYHLKRWKND